MASDFRIIDTNDTVLKEISSLKASGRRIGLIQMYHYDLEINRDVSPLVRELVDGDQVQMLVYGEKMKTDALIVLNPVVLNDWQQYIPGVDAEQIHVLDKQALDDPDEEHAMQLMQTYFGSSGMWHAGDMHIQELAGSGVVAEAVASRDGKRVADDAGQQ